MRIGPYRVVGRLGHGGMAEVFRARAVGAAGFETDVAIKVLRPELEGDADAQRRLVLEATIGAQLRHRHVVRVDELGFDGARYFVRMEYVPGCNLAEATRREPTPVPIALTLAAALAEALAYVETATDPKGRPLALVHRDVSPANVLVARHGDLKLADLGIAKATKLAETTQANLRRGKYAYMSPEQVRGDALTARSDQFGFGVLLAELLTGARPFDGPTPVETMDRIREAALPPLPLEPDLDALVRRCLQRDPAARFGDARALLAAITEARWRRAPTTLDDVGAWVRERTETAADPGRISTEVSA